MSNLVKVYRPDGEMFEMSHLNANDLTSHAPGWSYDKPIKAKTKDAEEIKDSYKAQNDDDADTTSPKDEFKEEEKAKVNKTTTRRKVKE